MQSREGGTALDISLKLNSTEICLYLIKRSLECGARLNLPNSVSGHLLTE